MAYTIPEYVDTREQAILAVASAVKGEAVTGGNGTVNRALDILTDVLAGEDIDVPQTDAGAILALASYVSGGGGGPQTTDVYLWNEDTGLGAHGVTSVKYLSGTDSHEEAQFEGITDEVGGTTIYGVKAKDVPAGAQMILDTVNGAIEPFIGYAAATFPPSGAGPFAPMPIDGLYAVGSYNTDA